MKRHRWIGIATARMTEEQAADWTRAEGTAVQTPLGLRIGEVVCGDCGLSVEDEPSPCLGVDPERAHHWTAFMTLGMNDEEALAWHRDEDLEPILLPQAVGVVCALCGLGVEAPDTVCAEREAGT